jgi:hypothetical protein
MVRRIGAAAPPWPGFAKPLALGGASLTLLAATVGALAACGDSGPPSCVAVEPQCVPRYQPTFANVYENTLKNSCGSQASACHSAIGQKGGLSMESQAVAYAALLQLDRVVPGDPGCSRVVVRLQGSSQPYLMPPGAQLPPADRCAIEQWIAAGAPAPVAAPAFAPQAPPSALPRSP